MTVYRVRTPHAEYELYLHTAEGREGPFLFRTLRASARWLQRQTFDIESVELWRAGQQLAVTYRRLDEKIAA